MMISGDDPQIPANQLSRLRLPPKDINAIKAFVKNNSGLLDKLADEEIDIADFIQKMKV
jgi:hypothetical protein